MTHINLMLERNFIHCWNTFIFNVGIQFYIMLNTNIFYASFSYIMFNEIIAIKLYVILHRYTFYDCYHCFLCEYMFMMFVLVTCLSIVYSLNRICMNLTLIIYASLKYKTISKRDLAAARSKNFKFFYAMFKQFLCVDLVTGGDSMLGAANLLRSPLPCRCQSRLHEFYMTCFIHA
jgi:hypothetical protein